MKWDYKKVLYVDCTIILLECILFHYKPIIEDKTIATSLDMVQDEMSPWFLRLRVMKQKEISVLAHYI